MDTPSLRNVCSAGKQALVCFLLSVSIFSASFFSGSTLGFSSELWALKYWGPALYFCLFNFILRYSFKGFLYEVSVRSTFLGTIFATGLHLATFDNGWRVLGRYLMVFSGFHFSEFMTVALTNPRTLSVDSFILNHSVQYWVAAVASWVEFGLEYYFFPNMKMYFWLSNVGVCLCVVGEILRKLAMFTATTNFNHMVQYKKQPDHQLVTHGVYSFFRHPSYVGWFYWSVGTQLVTLNPVCMVFYGVVSWVFFRERVFAEETTLLAFFGNQYRDYQQKVRTGLPFIQGNVAENTTQGLKREHWSY
ncbi:protein-S-isoprenylcysteine O-methyltransferase [Plodia interpunctella]|uniref:protein-S-isoprenylcysteine O-methyltransferase n=1 Tax=Plodia interpunctella TaxID=58824 RepID=UPI0023686EF2|nr:protein-S-isoprenylcysteine O-methyltransferase [Plodia interpunctella]